MLDNFSEQAEDYARYRPTFPDQLIKDISALAENTDLAWDIATGNGQVAVLLAKHFHQVIATDMSEHQLAKARKGDNIVYHVEPAEDSSMEDHCVDLATVAQAIHWFDFDTFYKEARRVIVPGGILAIIGYGFLRTQTDMDKVLLNFHNEVLKDFWDPQRRFVDHDYKTIPFPLKEIKLPGTYQIRVSWKLSELLGYLSTWSAVRHYIRQMNQDPVALIVPDIMRSWPAGSDHVEITFPVVTRIGRV